MSANMAMQMAEKEGFNVKMLLTHEDIAPGINTPIEDRRGLVGCIPLYKIAGAAAEAAIPLASTTSTTGHPVTIATLAVVPSSPAAPSNRPITPSPMISSTPADASLAAAEKVSGRMAQPSRLMHGRPLAAAWNAGSM